MPTLTVGQTVSVPWGLDVLEGTVLRVYGTGSGSRAVVRVHIPGTGGDESEGEDATLTLPTDAVEPIDDSPDRPRPGSWVDALAYEQLVAAAVQRILAKIAHPAEVSEPSSESDQGIDMVIHSGDSMIAIEAKYLSSKSRLPEREVDRAIDIAGRTLLPLLLVTNANPAPGALSAFRKRHETAKRLGLVRWRSPADDTDLESELRLLLSEPPNPLPQPQ